MRNFQKALDYSFLLLKYRPRSKNEIKFRLKKKGYSRSLAEAVVNYLAENNYINDQEFIDLFVLRSKEKGWGPRRIEFNLKRLGIPAKLRQRALAAIDCRGKIREIIKEKIDYYKNKDKLAKKRLIQQRIVRFLVAKGFDYDDIFDEMNNLEEDRL